MEPINYRDALRRRWRVIPVLALVGALIGGLFPVKVPYPPPHNQFEATALIGVTPGSSQGPNAIGAYVSVQQLIFFAAKPLRDFCGDCTAQNFRAAAMRLVSFSWE